VLFPEFTEVNVENPSPEKGARLCIAPKSLSFCCLCCIICLSCCPIPLLLATAEVAVTANADTDRRATIAIVASASLQFVCFYLLE
jgi:hypothetical protein